MKICMMDVESIGLFGPAVSYALVACDTDTGKLFLEEHVALAKEHWPDDPDLDQEDVAWANQHISISGARLVDRHWKLAHAFINSWRKLRRNGFTLAADCPFPVETTFVGDCLRCQGWDNMEKSPYPFLDATSAMLAVGIDPMASHPRCYNEWPVHNALADARQSMRLLSVALQKGKGGMG